MTVDAKSTAMARKAAVTTAAEMVGARTADVRMADDGIRVVAMTMDVSRVAAIVTGVTMEDVRVVPALMDEVITADRVSTIAADAIIDPMSGAAGVIAIPATIAVATGALRLAIATSASARSSRVATGVRNIT